MAIDEPAVYCSLDIFPKFNTVEVMQQFDKSMGGVVVDSLNQHNTDLLACLWNDLYTVISLQKEKGPRAPSVTSRVF